ncbi:hypothetical protein ACFCX0_32285 [Streptomyces sp. NPDC056352]|uniref:hypothetical protein n=1 Tax=Streptomyces sp. NPDC056352 TaxID=3345791 RepID=UPI0035D6A2AA
MTALVVAASLFVGVSLGILGGGGSILTVPILVYLAGQDTKEAIRLLRRESPSSGGEGIRS